MDNGKGERYTPYELSMVQGNRSQKIRNHLTRDYTEPVRDPLWRHIYLSPGLKRIISTPEFQKLGGIKQLGPAYLVYPGATHTRLNHSLGVFHLAKRIIEALLAFSDVTALLSPVGVRSFLSAALLHDLGHFPFAHALKELPLKEHERLTAEIIMNTDLAKIIRNEVGGDPATAARIVDLTSPANDDAELRLYRGILSGALDPDKLDYLSRDAYFCGVTYGEQDIDFVINKLRFQTKTGLLLEEPGVAAVENILFSKYLMYRSVYWHKTVRTSTAMIKKAVYTAMIEGEVSPTELYGLDDEDFFRRFSPERVRSSSLVTAVNSRRLHKLVFELPFDDGNPRLAELSDLERRAAAESALAAELSRRIGMTVAPEAVIIDVPEPITFEIDLTIEVNGELVPFGESGTVFGPAVVSGFTKTLRKLRLFVASRYADELLGPAWVATWAGERFGA